ncbi:unnamed protein product [Boreogadus saida]
MNYCRLAVPHLNTTMLRLGADIVRSSSCFHKLCVLRPVNMKHNVDPCSRARSRERSHGRETHGESLLRSLSSGPASPSAPALGHLPPEHGP